jgi:SAM-dependent methyltransferase
MKSSVAEYYGRQLEQTDDLEFGACCTTDYDAALTSKLTDEVLDKRYGCGSPIPSELEGATVLDLGCGAGADCFIASQLVGESGEVIGLDMTEEQLEVARRNVEPHMENFGYESPNVSFRHGEIEDIPLEDGSVDVVISNCVINLSTDKQAVYDEIWRVLTPGGEFYISDIVADRRLPEHLREDDHLWSECLAGALYVDDLADIESEAGFRDVRVVESNDTGDVLEGTRFFSQIRRGFKLDLDPRLEDYAQTAVYRGTIADDPETFVLDEQVVFEAGEVTRVSRNTARMLRESRYAPHFEVSEPLRHTGPFDRGRQLSASSQSGGCC